MRGMDSAACPPCALGVSEGKTLKPSPECRIFEISTNVKGIRLSTGSARNPETGSGRKTRGFTLLEMTVVLVLTALTLGFASLSFSGYYQRIAARRAALVFAQDLTLARATAVRIRESVVIRFYESSRWYVVETQSGSVELSSRRFGDNADINLSAINLNLTGDSMVFNSRGIADISGASGALGTASFSSGATMYTVSFNSMGASKVEQT